MTPAPRHRKERTLSIRYVCSECRETLNVSGFPTVNEVGRKYCDACGSNEDDLEVVDQEKFDIAMKRYQEAKQI